MTFFFFEIGLFFVSKPDMKISSHVRFLKKEKGTKK